MRLELARQMERAARVESEVERLGRELRKREEANGALGRELTAARTRVEELTNRLLRATADFENHRRRAKRDVDDARRFGIEALLKELLVVLDNFERAIEAGGEDSPVVVGVRMVQKLLLETLARHGLEGFDALGQAFDPTRHDAADLVERPGVPAGQIVQVYQKGYLLRDRLVRWIGMRMYPGLGALHEREISARAGAGAAWPALPDSRSADTTTSTPCAPGRVVMRVTTCLGEREAVLMT